MLRVGKITYANCTPIFDGLEHMDLPDVEIVTGVPSELNQALAQGNIDLCISSSIEYPRHAEEYLILPDFCIGSDGSVESVLMFSTLPIEELSGREILVTSESATSVILLQILLRRHFGLSDVWIKPVTLSVHEALKKAPAVLVIGDTALKAYLNIPNSATCHDLGTLWKAYTGLPFVYALWLLNKRTIENKRSQLAQFAQALITVHDQMKHQLDGLSKCAEERSWIDAPQLLRYWSDAIQYRMTDAHRVGLERFYRDAYELGYVPAVPELHFLA